MNEQTLALIFHWVPDGTLSRLAREFPTTRFVDARNGVSADDLAQATTAYGLPPLDRLDEMGALRWVQLASAGVPRDFNIQARQRSLTVTNLAGLYGPTIAEHALAMTTLLARNLHIVLRNQSQARWDRDVMKTMWDLQGRVLGVVGLGNIGRGIARLARAYGMRVVGCRRTNQPVPEADQVYPLAELRAMLAEADIVAVAAPLIDQTQGMLGEAEFQAMKRGVYYINVSRGPIAQEAALLSALRSGHVAAAGLDVFAVEPLPTDHPFWSMPQVIVSPHYSGETVNNSAQPSERFLRNLHHAATKRPLEGLVNTEWGY